VKKGKNGSKEHIGNIGHWIHLLIELLWKDLNYRGMGFGPLA